MLQVFLGGTVPGWKWREDLVDNTPRWFVWLDPVAKRQDEEAKARELKFREEADALVYTVTPDMKGVYAIAEAVDDVNKSPERTIFCIASQFNHPWERKPKHSVAAVAELIERNGGTVVYGLHSLAEELKHRYKAARTTWLFTFGYDHAHPNGYVEIVGSFESAREKMIACYGDKWSWQYPEPDRETVCKHRYCVEVHN